MDLSVQIGSLRLKNPLIAASGCFGYGVEYEGLIELSRLGGVVSKGLYLEPRDGAPVPRIAETPAGLLNAIGLQGIGIHAFVKDVLPRMRKHDIKLTSQPLTPPYLASQDCVLIVTDHSAVDWNLVCQHSRLVIDPRNALGRIPGNHEHVIR